MTKMREIRLARRPRTIGDLCRYIEQANTVIDDGFVDVRTHNPDLPKQINRFLKDERE
jgi:hypothetical protein